MSLYRNVTSKPWLTPGLHPDAHATPAFEKPNEKVALSFFMAVATVLFSLLVVSSLMRMSMGNDWVSLDLPSLLWLNTGTLVVSSIAFQMATSYARRGYSLSGLRWRFVTGGLLAIAFIVGQYVVWQQLEAAGYGLTSNPANDFFYLFTGLHVAHLLGGLWVWSKTLLALMRAEDTGEVRLNIELCTTYWHFLLLVWLVLFYFVSAN
ncbi:MAG: cytochrome c oxidase subunit 3 [Pseudomonadota bacterium]